MHDDKPNVHGLRRSDFREPARRELRQACGFGCVICGRALYEYAHVDPPFDDAETHDIDRMALLCPEHHDELDRWERISKAYVMVARANPRAKQQGFARDHLQCHTEEFILTIGSVFFCDCWRILNIEGSDILRIDPPETPDAPHRINGIFCDATGALVANIVQNEITYRSSTWDIEMEGPKITMRAAPRQICLVLITIPDRGLRIGRMNMMWAGATVTADDNELVVSGTANSKVTLAYSPTFQSCEHCIQVQNGRVSVGGMTAGAMLGIMGGGILGRRQ